MARSTAATKRQANRMIKRLRDMHELGKRSYETNTTDSLAEFASSEGFGVETVYKARRFYQTYSKRELEQLCRLRRSVSELPFHWSHVIYLIYADGRRRRSLENKVVASDLTAGELLTEIKRRQGARSRPGSGKPLKDYDDVTQLLAAINDSGRRWIRRAKQLAAKKDVVLPKPEIATLRKTLAGMVCQAERLVRGKVLRTHRRAKS